MIWFVVGGFWAVAVVLAFWSRAAGFFLGHKVLSVALLEVALLVSFRLLDGRWPVPGIGVAVGMIWYVWQRERVDRRARRPGAHGD